MNNLSCLAIIFGSTVLMGCTENPDNYMNQDQTYCTHDQDGGKFYMFHEGVPGTIKNGAFYESVDAQKYKTTGDGTQFYSGKYTSPDETVFDISDKRTNYFSAIIRLDGTGECVLQNGEDDSIPVPYNRVYELKAPTTS